MNWARRSLLSFLEPLRIERDVRWVLPNFPATKSLRAGSAHFRWTAFLDNSMILLYRCTMYIHVLYSQILTFGHQTQKHTEPMNVAILHSVVCADSPYTVMNQLLHKRHLNIDINIHLMLHVMGLVTCQHPRRRKITSTLSFSLEPEQLETWKCSTFRVESGELMKRTNSQGSLWCCRLLLLGRWNLANDRAARYVMQAWGRVCDGVDIGDNLGACSTKEWMDAVVSAKSLRVYSRRVARWYDRHTTYRQHWTKIRGFSPWPFCSSWNNSPRHSKGASLPIPAVKTAGTYRKDDDPWRIWTWLWQDIPVSAYSRHALKMDSFSWHPMFCKKLLLSLGWRSGCSEWNLPKTPNFQIGEFIVIFVQQISQESESMCQRHGMKISLHVSNTSAEAEGLCAYRLLRLAGRSVSTGSDFGWTVKNVSTCHMFSKEPFATFEASQQWFAECPRCVGTGNPVDAICRSFLRPLARNTVHNLQDPWLFQMEAFWKGQKTDRVR